MTTQLFIGVDGGATKCVVRVEDEVGNVLGTASDGPANIRLSVEKTWHAIQTALQSILQPLSISLGDAHYQLHAGMGLAGCEMAEARAQFLQQVKAFTTLQVVSDAHTACLGAHLGEDGAIIIAGTGTVGFQIQQGQTTRVGGWGFPQDDEGSGAWLGLEAVKATLRWLDGRLPVSGLAKAVYAHFNHQQDALVHWSNQANSTAYASLARIVFEEYHQQDPMAITIIKQAARAIDSVGDALLRQQIKHTPPLPCTLVGGVAPLLAPLLSESLQSRLSSLKSTPEAGAIQLVRQYLAKGYKHDE